MSLENHSECDRALQGKQYAMERSSMIDFVSCNKIEDNPASRSDAITTTRHRDFRFGNSFTCCPCDTYYRNDP